jgi:hypothetical protein
MSQLISEHYRQQLEELHKPGDWGNTASRSWEHILEQVDRHGANSFLDYGSGRGFLGKMVEKQRPGQYQVTNYEPGLAGYENNNTPHDFVVCVDVLEHIEPELLENVLDDLQRVTLKAGYFQIAHFESLKTLPDGRNVHLIVEPPEWWEPKITSRFNVERKDINSARSLYVVTTK